MIILEKSFNDIICVKDALVHIPEVGNCMNNFAHTIDPNNDNYFNSYDEFLHWAIYIISKNVPSPFSISYPSCYGLNISSNFFTLRFPGNFGIGIKVDSNKNGISYEVNFIFYGNDKFVAETKEYKSMIEDGWKVKPNTKNHK